MEKKFGKEYILIHELGKGGMAEVYLAIKRPKVVKGQPRISKLLAIKTMISSFSSNSEFIKMFEEETDIVMNMSHKNIASVIGHNTVEEVVKGERKQKLVLELEFIRGKNLRQILKDLYAIGKDLAFEEKIYVVKELAASLDYAHRFVHPKTGEKLHLVHSDISPQNAMVSIEGEVKLIDFGISKRNDPGQMAQVRAKKLQGKFSYMSPEQADGLEIDQKTDVFSLGIILWELLSRKRLFYGNTQAKILRKVKEAHIPKLKDISPETPHMEAVEKIVRKALIRDRNLRKFSANDFHQELSSLLNVKYPNFNPIHLGYKIQNFYKQEFDNINQIIKSSLEKLEKKGVEFDEKTKTITLAVSPKDVTNSVALAFDSKTASQAANKVHFNTITEQNTITYSNNSHVKSRNPNQDMRRRTASVYQSTSIKKIGSSIFFKVSMFAMLLGGVVSALYFKTKYPEETDKITKNVNILFQDAKKGVESFIAEMKDTNKTLASKAKPVQISIFVSSHPSKAKIFIDEVWDYKRTPKQIRFDKGQTIILRREGYEDYALSEGDINRALVEENQIFIILRQKGESAKKENDSEQML